MRLDEIGPAIARMHMLAAGPVDDAGMAAIREQLAAFDEPATLDTLAVETAIAAAAKFVDGAAIALTDHADLIAFGMVSHAANDGRDGLDRHLDDLAPPLRLAVAVSLLAMWRQACAAAAAVALHTLEVPETIPEERR